MPRPNEIGRLLRPATGHLRNYLLLRILYFAGVSLSAARQLSGVNPETVGSRATQGFTQDPPSAVLQIGLGASSHSRMGASILERRGRAT